MVPLTEQDDIEAYLVTLERIMEAYTIPTDLLLGSTAHQKGSTGICCITPGGIQDLCWSEDSDPPAKRGERGSLQEAIPDRDQKGWRDKLGAGYATD